MFWMTWGWIIDILTHLTHLWISSDSIGKSLPYVYMITTPGVCVCLCIRGSLLLKCVLAALLASSVFPVVGTDRANEGDRGREKISAAHILYHSVFFLQLSFWFRSVLDLWHIKLTLSTSAPHILYHSTKRLQSHSNLLLRSLRAYNGL